MSSKTSEVKVLSKGGLAIQLINVRKPPFCELEFDLALGTMSPDGEFVGLAVIKKNFLKTGGKRGFWVQVKGEAMKDKDGQPLLNDKGYPKYDNILNNFFGSDNRPTKASYQFFDIVTDLAVALREGAAAETSGRGAAPAAARQPARQAPRQAPRQATAPVAIDEPEIGDEDADEIPF